MADLDPRRPLPASQGQPASPTVYVGLAIAVAAILGLIAWFGPESERGGTNEIEIQRPHTDP